MYSSHTGARYIASSESLAHYNYVCTEQTSLVGGHELITGIMAHPESNNSAIQKALNADIHVQLYSYASDTSNL